MKYPDDIWFAIALHIEDGETWKSFLLISKQIYHATKPIHQKQCRRFSNHLWTLVKKFPYEKWNNFDLFENVNTNWRCIRRNKWVKWMTRQKSPGPRILWMKISSNPNVTLEIVKNNRQHPWNWDEISYNRSIHLKDVLDNLGEKWNWTNLTCNENITWEDISYVEDLPWCWGRLVWNPNISWKNFLENRSTFLSHIMFDWIWEGPRISWEAYMDLLGNEELNLEGVENTEFPSWKLAANNPGKQKWKWDVLSMREDVTWDIVVSNPHLPWDWKSISRNSNITWEIIVSNTRFPKGSPFEGEKVPWNWKGISLNPNITWDIVVSTYQEEVPGLGKAKWDFYRLSRNTFGRKV